MHKINIDHMRSCLLYACAIELSALLHAQGQCGCDPERAHDLRVGLSKFIQDWYLCLQLLSTVIVCVCVLEIPNAIVHINPVFHV